MWYMVSLLQREGSLVVTRSGIKPGSLNWELRALTAGPLCKSLSLVLWNFCPSLKPGINESITTMGRT